jgi:hypothetical protein
MLTSNYTAVPIVPATKDVIKSEKYIYFAKQWGGFAEDMAKMVENCTDNSKYRPMACRIA